MVQISRRFLNACFVAYIAVSSQYTIALGFWSHSRGQRRSPTSASPALLLSASGRSDDDTKLHADDEKKLINRQRYPDFPSFCFYDSEVASGNILPRLGRRKLGPRLRVKVSSPHGNGEDSKSVIPADDEDLGDDEEEESYLESLLIPLFGPVEAGLSPLARRKLFLKERSYALPDALSGDNAARPPDLEDVAAFVPRRLFEGFWVSGPAFFLTFGVSYLTFPYLVQGLDFFVTMPPEDLDGITSKFGPGVSIIYGTFVSLTISILYDRIKAIQDNVAAECALLTTTIRMVLELFENDKERAVEAGQCVADQLRSLIGGSWGAELMKLVYTNPYARLMELVNQYEKELIANKDLESAGGKIGFCRDSIKDLTRIRANRLSDEVLGLPPTHFLVLNSLTFLILAGYTVSILPIIRMGQPTAESSFLFGILTTVYVLFYNFAQDINEPFDGVYQIRRAVAASHMMEAKWLMMNHPMLRGQIEFTPVEQESSTSAMIRSPGLKDLWFEKDEARARQIEI